MDAIKATKKEKIDHTHKECNFLVDFPTSNGGNTNKGPVSERFFARENRASICAKISKASDRAAYSILLLHFDKMLSITQRKETYRVVDVEKMKALDS